MHPKLRTTLAALLGSAVAIWIGVNIAQEEYLGTALGSGLCLWALLAWVRGPLAEAWLLGFLIFGYVIGNRGFAQVAPLGSLPAFFSELGLAFTLAVVILRSSLQRELPVKRDALNMTVLLWVALGSSRIWTDARLYGFVALRDFATVYYALYFFVAQSIASHEPSRRLLRGALTLTFSVLPVTMLLSDLFPEVFYSHLLIKGVPLIYYKGDLATTFLYAGFLWLLPLRGTVWQQSWWRWIMALMSLGVALTQLSRSSMVGLAVAVCWLTLAGRWRPLRVFATFCACGVVFITVFSLFQRKDFTQTRAYAMYEAVASIGDVEGTRAYKNIASSDKSDNNRFRLVWWKNVARETMETSPLLGMGFGHDLAKGFLLEYYPVTEAEFTTRSPHNIYLTILGRMGLLGVAGLLAIYISHGRETWHSSQQARKDPNYDEVLTLQAMCWVVMISACFGVVLEGPMGAIPLWSILGLAHFTAKNAAVPNPA